MTSTPIFCVTQSQICCKHLDNFFTVFILIVFLMIFTYFVGLDWAHSPFRMTHFTAFSDICHMQMAAGALYFNLLIKIRINPLLTEASQLQRHCISVTWKQFITTPTILSQNSLTGSKTSIYSDSKKIFTVCWVNNPYFKNPLL